MHHGVDAAKELRIVRQQLPFGGNATGRDKHLDGIRFEDRGDAPKHVFLGRRISFSR